ncbi:F0F1 ATP synthase subunit A [Patescibacteria group bacterium]|nr:F0F1 ATP synthase subunit A [Patescibacteria group bacterium]
MNFFSVQRDIPGIDPVFLFHIGGFPIAASTVMIFLIIVLFVVFAVIVRRSFRIKPTRFQVLIEYLYQGMIDMLDEVTNDKKRSAIIFPIIGSIFMYLLVANLLGLVPGLSELMFDGKQIFQTPTGDFNTTFGLALGAIIVINIISIKEWGILSFLGKFFKVKEVIQAFKKSVGEGAISLVDLFVGMLDIVGEIAKVISLSIRLFANMYAGQILMIILMGAFAYILPGVWYGMNIFVGALQAMVFAVLVAAYYMLAIKPDADTEEQTQE